MRPLATLCAALAFGLAALPAMAVTCGPYDHEGRAYTICEVDPATDDLRLFLNDATGVPYGNFAAVESALGRPLLFAMNAGMYHEDRRPVGLYVEAGEEGAPLVTRAGPGNFGMLPNGVFCIAETTAQVIETSRYRPGTCRDATQSGPMLVIDGELHPRFLPDGTSRNIRNGVGSSADGTRVVFAISDERVTFHEFGRLFRDALGLPQALYFDGRISRLHAPSLGRSDAGLRMGPIVGVVDPG